MSATAAVIDRMAGCESPRLREIMTSVVTHLHAVIREVEPTQEEWLAAIAFLTDTGKICDDKRQEFILLSDTLGVSMLADAINNRKPSGATESTVLGPFHVAGAPPRTMGDTISLDGKGDPAWVSGRVLDLDGNPIEGACLDVWQSSSEGAYDVQDPDQPDMNLRGLFTTGKDGRYYFRTVRPSSYPVPTDGPVGGMLTALGRHPMRPAHIHFIVGAPGFEPVTTHVFVAGDPYLDSDAVFGVKSSLVEPFVETDDSARASELGLANPFYVAGHDFVLARQAEAD
ncbi:intradiol ring-cleavage dioxygenase [Bauldia sp.]|uniref:intradiol ring-cleavage dioxygenase n=1 Tax=Bauldia sp. TaxID=2575872 RepID=UPI0025C01770|nr:intradiol ring-cleavage dioxygenase [Bauldia sp.]